MAKGHAQGQNPGVGMLLPHNVDSHLRPGKKALSIGHNRMKIHNRRRRSHGNSWSDPSHKCDHAITISRMNKSQVYAFWNNWIVKS